MDILSLTWLYALVPLVLGLALLAPLYVMLGLGMAFVMLPGSWYVGGVWLDPTDLVFAGIGLAFLVRRQERLAAFKHRVPYLGVWVALGIVASIAYLSAPINSPYLTDPFRIAYQLYRYTWKSLLYFPLSVMLLGDRRKLQVILFVTLAAADAAALQGISQGYAGDLASGPFDTKNALGGVLVAPMVISIAGVMYPESTRRLVFYAVSTLLMARALLFSQSRGAQVAVFLGVGFLAYRLFTTAYGRSRIVRFIAWAAVLAVVVMTLKPNVLQSPDVQRLFSTSQGTEDDTMQWRMQERWPHFWKKVVDNPWFGVGTDVDPTLGDTGNTPHNGFLAIAVIEGVPALCLFLTLILQGIRNGLLAFKRGADWWQRVLGLTTAAALIGTLVHNTDDATLLMPFIGNMVWMLTAVAVLSAKRYSIAAPTVVPIGPARKSQRSPLSPVAARP